MSDLGEYRIGTVSKLTGVDPHTIRAWERRYQAIVPRRTDGGTRLYGDGDVHRLRLLKAVTDAGDAIGVVANLADGDLRARLSALAGAGPEPGPSETHEGPPRIAVLGESLAERLRERAGLVIAHESDALDGLLDAQDVRALVVHLPALGDTPSIALERLQGATGVRTAVVIYEFAPRRVLAELARRGAALLRGPLAPGDLERSISDLLTMARIPRRAPAPVGEGDVDPPERLFDDAQLVRLREIASSVQCECPNHLATLVESLVAFESYSRRCESVDDEDAELHGRLARGTGRARAAMEALLAELMDYDDLSI